MSAINETLKQKIDELDLDRRLNQFADQAESAIGKALDSASTYARDHREDIESTLLKVTGTIDDRTEGRFAGHVAKVRDQVVVGVGVHPHDVPFSTWPDRNAPAWRGMADARARVGECIKRLGVELGDALARQVLTSPGAGAGPPEQEDV